ncbi:hypothetical protein [Cecembia sp.]|uniref:hypothetical protein n=1 Tax=Cecembia sp. TaxID=1898110 RepID=UPI0025C15937|nr:hypothetical protein [Cecembia sp.]
MDIQTEKLRLIEWLAGLDDKKVLQQLISLKRKQEMDWWDTISREEKEEIEMGLKQAENNDFVNHEEVMAKYKKWL